MLGLEKFVVYFFLLGMKTTYVATLGGGGGKVAGGLSRLIYSFSLLDPTFLPLCFPLESTYHMAREISLGLAFGTESVKSSVI